MNICQICERSTGWSSGRRTLVKTKGVGADCAKFVIDDEWGPGGAVIYLGSISVCGVPLGDYGVERDCFP